jgi:hypothetical protein
MGDSWRLLPNWSMSKWIKRIPIPALGYFAGLDNILHRQVGDEPYVRYLLGERFPKGWWYISLVAFAVKTPLAELFLFLLALLAVPAWLRTMRWRDLHLRWYLLFVPVICYLVASLISPSNVGERHLLPIYPFLFVLSAAILLRGRIPRWRAAAVAIAGLGLIAETASIHPHYLAFFNALSGGPARGSEYLVESNLDWGQDLKKLKGYFDRQHISDACVSYFGYADLDYYHVPHRPLPPIPDAAAARQLHCVAAISVTYLVLSPDLYGGFYDLAPSARIGYSINVYDMRGGSNEGPP